MCWHRTGTCPLGISGYCASRPHFSPFAWDKMRVRWVWEEAGIAFCHFQSLIGKWDASRNNSIKAVQFLINLWSPSPADRLGDKREDSPLRLVCAWYSEPPLFTSASLVLKAAQKEEFLDLLPCLLLRHTRGSWAGFFFVVVFKDFFLLFILENTRNLLSQKTHAERGGKKGGKKTQNKPTTSSQRAQSVSLLRQHLLPSLLHPQGEGVERFTLHQAVSNAAGGSCRAQGRPLTPRAAPSPQGGSCRPPPPIPAASPSASAMQEVRSSD